MKKLSENLFAPAFDRSRTGEKRKEDDIFNHLTPEELYDYIKENYVVDNYTAINYSNSYYGFCIIVPIIKSKVNKRVFTYVHFIKNEIRIHRSIESENPELFDKIKEKYSISHTDSTFLLTPESGNKPTNNDFIEFLDFIIEVTDGSCLRKKENK